MASKDDDSSSSESESEVESPLINFWKYCRGDENGDAVCLSCKERLSTKFMGRKGHVARVRTHFNVDKHGNALPQAKSKRRKICPNNPFADAPPAPSKTVENTSSNLELQLTVNDSSATTSNSSSSTTTSTSTVYYASPRDLRLACRSGVFNGQTSGQANGYAQANLCILPKPYAFDFLLFCQRNPKPCPLLQVLEPGVYQYEDIDIRTDLPRYRVFQDGVMARECENIADIWAQDYVTFIIGCSFSFEDALMKSGLTIRHIEQKRNVPMYRTNIPCQPAGIFHGNLVVSMRPFKPNDVAKAVEISARYPRVHGAPVHIGNPRELGIKNLNHPDYGEAVDLQPGEIPVFWACGVTPQSVVMSSKPSICITHAPGHMLVVNQLNEQLSLS